MDPAVKTYTFRMLGTSLGYAGSLIGVNMFADGRELSTLVGLGLVAVPVLFGFAMFASVILFAQSRDEVQQRYLSEAALWTLGLFGLGSFTYSFVQDVISLPDLPMDYILPIIAAIWAVCCFICKGRYG